MGILVLESISQSVLLLLNLLRLKAAGRRIAGVYDNR